MLKAHLAKSRQSGSRALFDAVPSGPSLSAAGRARTLALALTGIVALSGVAEAESPTQSVWTGRYVGGSFAYAMNGDDRVLMLPSGARPGTLELSGGEAALQLGFNRQNKNLVWGLEGALSFAGIDNTVTDGTITARSEVSRAVEPARAARGWRKGAAFSMPLAASRWPICGIRSAAPGSRSTTAGRRWAMFWVWVMNRRWPGTGL